MIKVGVIGALGKMGKEVIKAVANEPNKLELVCAIDMLNAGEDIGSIVLNKENGIKIETDLEDSIKKNKPDVIVDFTQPSIIFENAKIMLKNKVRPVIGTTGLSEEQLEILEGLSKENNTSCIIAPNFSTGAILMMMFAKQASKYFDNAEIIELHHNQKKDAPSGTAIKTAKLMSEENDDFETNNCEEKEILKGSRGGISNGNIHIHSVRMPGYIASQEVIFGSNGQILTIRHDTMDRECYMKGVKLAIEYVYKNNKFIYGLENIM